jgi:hypothetical protein
MLQKMGDESGFNGISWNLMGFNKISWDMNLDLMGFNGI